MRMVLSALFLCGLLAGCAQSGGDGGYGASVPFKGTPRDFNGNWKGRGRASTEFWSEENLTYTVHINKTPEGADLYFDIREADSKSFSLGRAVGHYVIGNTIYSTEERQPVGEIGGYGFHLTRPGIGRFEMRDEGSGNLKLTGYLEYGETKIAIEADLSR